MVTAAPSQQLSRLSSRELDVLGLLAAGLSNGGIAAHLCVSDRTVDAHVSSIFLKLDLLPSGDHNRRVQAAIAWLDGHGLEDQGAAAASAEEYAFSA